MDYALRPATEQDYPSLWALKRETMRPYVEALWGGWDDAAQEKFFRRNFVLANIRVITFDGEDVGLLQLEREPQALFLANIQIKPAYQNRGLGSDVVRRVIEEARAAGLPLRLQVLVSNERARRLYERLGFTVTEQGSMHDQMRFVPAQEETTQPVGGTAGYP